MKFLIDSQLPYLLIDIIRRKGFDAIHIIDVLDKDQSTDKQIRDFADKENRIVITKDFDFYHSHIHR